MENYYSELAAKMLTDHDWSEERPKVLYSPRASFQIRGNFNHVASTVAYHFIVDFAALYGELVQPTDLFSGCIGLQLKFDDVKDYRGVPFIELLMNDDRYHNLFASYDVFRIFLTRFPPRYISHRYQLNFAGQPIVN